MSLYLKPPKGKVNLYILLECVLQRKKCFDKMENDFNIKQFEGFQYLVEDNILDRTGHFMFRLGVIKGLIPKQIFIENEVNLLKKRLECYDKNDMEYFLKKIIKQLKDCIKLNIVKELSDFYWTLYNVTTKMLKKGYISHLFDDHMTEEKTGNETEGLICQKESILIPFWYCNKFIAIRDIDLKDGNGIFDCKRWKDILPTLYEEYLKIVLNEMKFSRDVLYSLEDKRISGCLVKVLGDRYLQKETELTSIIKLKNLEQESFNFPLCMKNLYDSLKKNHRLAHNDRFDLSLFLKGVGLSLHDSIKFWENEYSKKQSCCSKCSHSWQGNEKKYIYGIRHLYGLEGSRKNYTLRSCRSLQESGLSINCEGGCPFVHYDDDFLRSALKQNLPNFDDDIEVMIFERKENPKLSCKLYADCFMKMKNKPSEGIVYKNPLEYYNEMKSKM